MYLFACGFIQKFGEKVAINVREANNQQVRDFTIKIAGDKLLRVTLWPEFAHAVLSDSSFVAVEGKFTQSGDQQQFLNISADKLHVDGVTYQKNDTREVVNQQPAAEQESVVPAAASSDSAPF